MWEKNREEYNVRALIISLRTSFGYGDPRRWVHSFLSFYLISSGFLRPVFASRSGFLVAVLPCDSVHGSVNVCRGVDIVVPVARMALKSNTFISKEYHFYVWQLLYVFYLKRAMIARQACAAAPTTTTERRKMTMATARRRR